MPFFVGFKSNAEPIPEGTYTAVCYLVADIGTQYSERWRNTSRKMVIMWELQDENKRFTVSKTYTATLSKKSTLYKDLRGWLGGDWKEEKLKQDYDLHSLVGLSCMIGIVHRAGEDGVVYSNVSSIMKLPSGMPAITPENECVKYSMDEQDQQVFDKLPEWIQSKITNSAEYKRQHANETPLSIVPEQPQSIQQPQPQSVQPQPQSIDIPF